MQRQYVPKIQLPTGTQLYWRVRGTGGGETWTTTPFSRNTVGAPTLIGPADAAELTQPDNPVTLSWQPVPGADSYDVQYGTDPNFVDQTTTKSVEASSYVVPLQTPGTYVWRVRGVLANGVFTAWSGGTNPLPPARTYKVMGLANDSAIPPTSPPDDANQALTDIVLDWEPIKGAKSYEIQVSTDALFPPATIVDQQAIVYGTRYSPPKTLNNDQYFWRIRASDAAGFEPDWSSRPVWHFKRTWPDQPTLLYPQNNATNVQTPFYYQWTPVKHASSYVVQISSGAGFPTPAPFPQECTTVHTTLVYGDEPGNCWPTTPGTYSWRVTARDEFSNEMPVTDGIAAPVGTFTYKPQLVTTTGPPSGSIYANPYDPNQSLGAPVLTWNPVAGADKYKVTIQGTTTQSFITAALSYAPRYLAPGTYSWDVQTVDALGAIGAGHATGQRTFTVKQPPMVEDLPDHPGQFVLMPVPDPLPAASPPHPTNPALGSSYRFPSLTWNPVTWVDHYELYVSARWQHLHQGLGRLRVGRRRRHRHHPPQPRELRVVRQGGPQGRDDPHRKHRHLLDHVAAGHPGRVLQGRPDRQRADRQRRDRGRHLQPQAPVELPEPPRHPGARLGQPGRQRRTLFECSRRMPRSPTRSRPRPSSTRCTWTATRSPDSQAGSAYFVVLLPCVVVDVCSSLTHSTHSFNKLTRPLTLVSPLDGAQVQNDVTLTWDDYLDSQAAGADPDTILATPGQDEASYYNVQTASDQNFVQNVTTTKVDQTTFTSFADTYPEGTTWWRVQAVDRNGNTLAWSAPRSFLKKSPVPQLQLPADGATVPGDYTLSWAAQPYAASYDIEVYKGGDTSGNTVNRVINDSTDRVQYVLTNLDPSSGPYAWRVRRHDGKNRPGDWSPYRTFSVIRPGVTLISPVDNDTTVSPADQLFTWVPVQGATSYKFERRPGTSGNATETVDTPSTKWAPIAAIAGGSWQWRVTAYDTANNLIADSSWLHPFSVTDTPIASVPVSITGSGVVDSTLTLNPPQWNMPNNLLTITYQWFRGTSPVAGATGVTYEVTSADLGKAITVKATATRPGYTTGTSTSNVITGTQAGAPLASVPVVINGTGFYGSTLQLSPPTWDVGGVATTYQWFRGTSAISGQTGTSYVVGASDMAKEITVKATGTKAGYVNGLSVSNAVTAALNPAPAATTPISLTGTGAVGSPLTMTPPVWDTADVTVTYQWFRDAAPFTNNPTTYTVLSSDVGKTITVKATAAKTGYVSGVSTSNGILASQASAVTPTTLPSITGVPAAKETLTATPGVWPGSGTKSYAYQWFVNGEAVAKETGSKYVVRTRDAGLPVSVRVTMTMNGFAPSVATSGALSVAKLSSTLTATVAKKKITQRERAVLTVKVVLLDFGVSLGQVQVKDGSKVIANPGLQTGKNGVLTIRLKKLKLGKHKLTITYLGSTSTLASSGRVTIKVVKGTKK